MEQETLLWAAAAALWGSAGIACLLYRRRTAGTGRQVLIAAAAVATAAALDVHAGNQRVTRLRGCLISAVDLAAAPPGGRPPPSPAPVRLVR